MCYFTLFYLILLQSLYFKKNNTKLRSIQYLLMFSNPVLSIVRLKLVCADCHAFVFVSFKVIPLSFIPYLRCAWRLNATE